MSLLQVLKSLSVHQLQRLSELLTEVKYDAGQFVIRQVSLAAHTYCMALTHTCPTVDGNGSRWHNHCISVPSRARRSPLRPSQSLRAPRLQARPQGEEGSTFHGHPWPSVAFHGLPWPSMAFH